jgi:hypothetical protein
MRKEVHRQRLQYNAHVELKSKAPTKITTNKMQYLQANHTI